MTILGGSTLQEIGPKRAQEIPEQLEFIGGVFGVRPIMITHRSRVFQSNTLICEIKRAPAGASRYRYSYLSNSSIDLATVGSTLYAGEKNPFH